MTPDREKLRQLAERADDRLGGISIDRLDGDNISILFCTYFESADEDADENGWTESATLGCDEMLKAIRAHYRPAFDAAQSEIDRLRADLAEAREALKLSESAMREYYRYWTGGETRGSYDGKPERNALWEAMRRAASVHSRLSGEGRG